MELPHDRSRAAAEESLLKLFNVKSKSNLEVAFKPKSCLHRLDDFFSASEGSV